MPPSRRRCTLLAVDLAMLMASGSLFPVTALARADNAPAAAAQTLYLEVHINRGTVAKLARFELLGQTLSASAATLRELGLRLPADIPSDEQNVALVQLPGAVIDYDAGNQRLALQVPLELLDHPLTYLQLSNTPELLPVSDNSPGILLNYDLHAQQSEHYRDASGYTELRVFGLGRGIWSTSQASRVGATQGSWHAGNTRLDSHWQLDLPGPMLSLSVGDTITGALQWSRSARIGGLHLSRNFSLQPYRVTTPLASFAGEAVLPSTVDLYINGIRQASRNVQPGQFQLDTAPALNGSGQAQLLVTDINGQSRMLEFALYGTPNLLQAGLTDWSLDIGVLRQGYGQHSFAYDNRPMASGSVRRGLYEQLTIEGHAELSADLRLAGIGAVALLGKRAGVLSSSFTSSRAAALQGHQQAFGYQWSSRSFNVSASTLRRSADFRDAPAFLANSLLPRRTDQLFLGLGNAHSGQFSLSYVSQSYPGNPRIRLAGLGWSRSLGGNSWLSAQFHHDLGKHGMDSANVYFSMPLDRLTQFSSNLRHGADGNALSLQANRSLATDAGGWGWRVQANLGARRSGSAELSHLSETSQWRIGADHSAAAGTLGYADAVGSLAWFGNDLHALRRVDDAFALVSTNGVADVPVRLENRLVGHTNGHGQLLVTPLRAWQRNLISIDTLGLPVDMLLDSPQRQVVPASGSGARVDFKLQPSHPMRLQLRDMDGRWLAAGSQVDVTLAGQTVATTVVGHDGEVYLADPPVGARLLITVAEGAACVLPLPTTAQHPEQDYATPLQCQP